MLTIKKLSDIEKLKRESTLPNTLVEFLEKTFRELHEAYELKTEIEFFSLERYGPIYLLQLDQVNTESLKQIRFRVEEGSIGCSPEWVEKIDLGDHQIWKLGIMTDNDYLFQLILPENEFGPEVESWLEELMKGV